MKSWNLIFGLVTRNAWRWESVQPIASWIATWRSQKVYSAGTRIRRQIMGRIPRRPILNWSATFSLGFMAPLAISNDLRF
jgi:hypothetical protein